MGVDNTNVASGSGRNSLRLTSTASYNHGLIILDLAHMPGGQCGTWPAFWMLGPNWPTNGELDIIEGVNAGSTNAMTLHTDSGCEITNTGLFSGSIETANCDVNAANQATNQGCSIETANSATYGAGFNAAGGGVYATEWTSDVISIWYFPRSAIPADITSGNPDPSGWGLALSSFSGGCDLDSHVDDMQIVFDTTFCGDWAGQVWSTDATCSPLAATCNDYVQNNPSAFAETYWSVNSLKVYQQNGAVASSTPSTSAAPSATEAPSSTSVTGVPVSTIYVTQYSSSVTESTFFSAPTTFTAFTTLATVTSSVETSVTNAPSVVTSTYSVPTTFATATLPVTSTWTGTWTNTWTGSWPQGTDSSWTGSWPQGTNAPASSWGSWNNGQTQGGWNGQQGGQPGGGW